jgi:hypothetical protein
VRFAPNANSGIFISELDGANAEGNFRFNATTVQRFNE